MKRLEFSKKVKVEMFLRAGGPDKLRCEGCGLRLMGKAHEYDHQIEEWERQNIAAGLRQPLTADDGKVLCIPCHDVKSGKKAGERAHGNRLVAKAARAMPKKSRPSKFKKKLDGTVVWRETGEPVR